LNVAVQKGHKNITALLIKAKIGIRSSNSLGQDALIIAAICKRDYMIPVLIKAGADVNREDISVCCLFPAKLPCITQHSAE
jgi:ankyrin repeat protein